MQTPAEREQAVKEHEARSCTGKARYNSKREAEHHRRLCMQRGDTGRLSIYPCEYCGFLHVGHNKRQSKRQHKAGRPIVKRGTGHCEAVERT